MGCARSKNRSNDDLYSGTEMEGRAGRYDPSRKSNESLIITVLWRRLSMFSRRGSTRKQSTVKGTSVARDPSAQRSVDPQAAESAGPEQQEELPLPEVEEDPEQR